METKEQIFTKEEVFTNIKMALKKTFNEVESYNVEHIGRDIAIKVPSKYFNVRNWNGKGLNGIVNVKLTFEDLHPTHPEDKEVTIYAYISDFFNVDKWYDMDTSNIKNPTKVTVYNKMCDTMKEYFSSIKNNIIIKGVESYRGNYEITLILDDNNDYDKALENAELLKRVIANLNQKVEEVVETAMEEFKQKLNEEEDEYQKIKAQRHATFTTIQQDSTISIQEVISQIKAKELSQEQIQKILNVIK